MALPIRPSSEYVVPGVGLWFEPGNFKGLVIFGSGVQKAFATIVYVDFEDKAHGAPKFHRTTGSP